jgi:hypothetical protein
MLCGLENGRRIVKERAQAERRTLIILERTAVVLAPI